MKIIEINAVCGKGSTGRICVELADGAIRNGHDAYILYGSGESTYPNSKKISCLFETKMDALIARITGINGYGAYASTKRVISFIKAYHPDIVHLHNIHAHYINLKTLLKFLGENNMATVITLHDCWFYTGKCTYYSAINCSKWKHECGKCPKIKEEIPSWFFDRTKKMLADKKTGLQKLSKLGVIGVSKWITNEAKQSFLKEACKIETIYNWIELDVFCPQNIDELRKKHSISREKFVVFCISESWKQSTPRYKDLINFIKKADTEWLILVAGNIDETIDNFKNVKRVGYINGIKTLAEYYNMADAYVHLSREDTFGKVIGEAMACGTPIVAYNTTVYPELVIDSCGYIVDVGDVEAICNALNKIEQFGKMHYTENCIELAKRFEQNQLIEQTIKFYEELQNCDEDDEV